MARVTTEMIIADTNDAHLYVPDGYTRSDIYEAVYAPYCECDCGETSVQCYANNEGDSFNIGICEHCGED